MSRKACLNCRERKLSCDKTLPTCERCSRSRLACKGYEFRVSWPRETDRKRFQVGKVPAQRSRGSASSGSHFVNSSFWDIQLYQYLLASEADRAGNPNLGPLKLWASPGGFRRLKTDSIELGLLEFFQHYVSQFIGVFGCRSAYVGEMLMRMALGDDSPSGTAILKSLLALSSLHRYGHKVQVTELKVSALRALKLASENGEIRGKDGLRHMAAVMTLCSIEASTSDDWTPYICSIKSIIAASSLGSTGYDSDFQILTDWAFFYDTLGYFAIAHWSLLPDGPYVKMCVGDMYNNTSYLSPLNLVEDTCNAVRQSRSVAESTSECRDLIQYIQVLEYKIVRSLKPSLQLDDDPNTRLVTELFVLALLVYLGRATSDIIPELEVKTKRRITQAFAIIRRLKYCDRKFPLFILGCEARNENDRAAFLDLVSLTHDRSRVPLLTQIETLVKISWTQRDLFADAGSEFDYIDMLKALIRSCKEMPAFV